MESALMLGLELRVSTQDTPARGFFRRLADILEEH